MQKKFIVAGAAVAILAAFATAAAAHHAVNAQFDVNREVSATGVLKEVHLINPHTYFDFEMAGPGAAPQKWEFEGISPVGLRRSGIKVKDELVPGRSFTVFYNPSRNGAPIGLLRGLVINGRRMNLAADYKPPES